MNNQIAILILCAFIGVGTFWFLLNFVDAVMVRRLRKKYKVDNDLSKQGELRRKQGESEFGRISEVTDRELLSEFERGQLFPTTNLKQAGNTEPVVRENRGFLGKLFKRK